MVRDRLDSMALEDHSKWETSRCYPPMNEDPTFELAGIIFAGRRERSIPNIDAGLVTFPNHGMRLMM